MPENPLNETVFEKHFADILAASPLYNARSPKDFDIANLCDREMLEAFLKAQTSVWTALTKQFGEGKQTQAVIDAYLSHIRRGGSMMDLFKKGIKTRGIGIKFVKFKPEMAGPEDEQYKLYEANRFSVVRQMHFSTDKEWSGKELDLCILLNGLPIITCELKNEGTNQNYNDGIYQYRYERPVGNLMLDACLVHFVIDNQFAFMTTKLDGEHTRFLPFNQDSVNPAVEDDYPTSYMYKQILQADSLLDLIENFIKVLKDDEGKRCVIFPRFHQMRAVRNLKRWIREEGPGHDYLIEHSAGSGKTKTMAWLAHQMANMTNQDNTPIYDCIIMVTDRIVLNKNMADDVNAFEETPGLVKDIRKGSSNLADAINKGYRIIISTVQKFSFALKDLKREESRKYAIIVDEAHTAVGNEGAKDLVNALSTDEDIRKVVAEYSTGSSEDELDDILIYLQALRKKMPHISYFAFTATPKDKTYALYGKDGKPHDLYSMKQAIDEKFILDVLKYYKSYKTMFELIEKDSDDDEQKLFEEKKSLKLIYDSLNKNSYIKLRKANMMVEHFMTSTINKIGRKAKAMVVTDSRQAAIDYKQIIDKIIQTNYNGAIKTLVAFSGEEADSHGRRWTEATMNEDNVHDNGIADKFKEDDFKILIVADKFQTGFDEPLLHTMYVDKSLGGIQCIQTLSRLNRCHDGKDDTMVIDFRNDWEKVKKAFQTYYTTTELVGEVDADRMYKIKEDIESYKIFKEEEVKDVVKKMLDPRAVVGVPSILTHIISERMSNLRDDEKDLYRKLINRYVRQYGFMAQLMDFSDPELESFYIFCKIFYKYLPYTKEVLPMEILDKIDLNKLRIQLAYEGSLELEDEGAELQSARIGEPGTQKPDEKRTIQEILDIANSPYSDILNENDKILRQLWEELMTDPQIADAFRAKNSFDNLMNLVKEKFDEKVADQIERYYNFSEILNREQGFSIMLMQKFVEALAEQTKTSQTFEYSEEELKEKLCQIFANEFTDPSLQMPSIEKIVDCFFYIMSQSSLAQLDSVDELIIEALSMIYLNPNVRPVDKKLHFNSLCIKYESFLKKLYYLVSGSEVTRYKNDGQRPTLNDAIGSFPCLWDLKKSNRPAEQKFSVYLENVVKWRNEVATHESPITNEAEMDAALYIVVSMYLFVVGKNVGYFN